ncbi:MAG: hypothetical protein EOP07_08825 [Proteobacteria bacterium]|nr:MAG: hypothetical protein EOP07_08825 [Pseudomonadota bacterium]
MNPFFDLLFDAGESTCLADNPKGTRILPISFFDPRRHGFFSINPIDQKRDNDPIAAYHHALKPRRADANVTHFRNLLVEMDKVSLTEQLEYVDAIQMPFSSCVYSGGKSYHFIISLENALPNRAAYDDLVRKLYSVLGERIDSSCKNPSRLSRAPGHLRSEKMKFQSLRELRSRVNNSDLEGWLKAQGAEESPKVATYESRTLMRESEGDMFASTELYRSSKNFLALGAADGEWNQSLFKAACDSFSKGWSHDDFVDEAIKITGHLDSKDQATIRSAWLRINRKTS